MILKSYIMENSWQFQSDNKENEKSSVSDHQYALKSDPGITYNHIDEESGIKMRYFSQRPFINGMAFWSLLFEEMIIVLMLSLLLLTQ